MDIIVKECGAYISINMYHDLQKELETTKADFKETTKYYKKIQDDLLEEINRLRESNSQYKEANANQYKQLQNRPSAYTVEKSKEEIELLKEQCVLHHNEKKYLEKENKELENKLSKLYDIVVKLGSSVDHHRHIAKTIYKG